VTESPASYQDYIRASLGEFTVAKQGYVASRSGWFSERVVVCAPAIQSIYRLDYCSHHCQHQLCANRYGLG
jgi:hypothetical protein